MHKLQYALRLCMQMNTGEHLTHLTLGVMFYQSSTQNHHILTAFPE